MNPEAISCSLCFSWTGTLMNPQRQTMHWREEEVRMRKEFWTWGLEASRMETASDKSEQRRKEWTPQAKGPDTVQLFTVVISLRRNGYHWKLQFLPDGVCRQVCNLEKPKKLSFHSHQCERWKTSPTMICEMSQNQAGLIVPPGVLGFLTHTRSVQCLDTDHFSWKIYCI